MRILLIAVFVMTSSLAYACGGCGKAKGNGGYIMGKAPAKTCTKGCSH